MLSSEIILDIVQLESYNGFTDSGTLGSWAVIQNQRRDK